MNLPEFSCKWCGMVLLDQDEHEEHTLAVHNKVPVFVCNKCDKTIRGTMNFSKHLTLVHGTTHWDLHLAIRKVKRQFKEIMN
jgi:uncharacterized C2H2 Zn-finger protein